jgi:hypothetical protein
MKRGVVLFVLTMLLFILSSTSISAETVFEGDIADEATETIDGITYTVYGYSDYTGARISSNDYGSVIIEEIGGSSSYGDYTYTLNDIYEGDDAIYFSITVEKSGGDADVSFSRSATNYNPVLGEHVEVTITFENSGSETLIIYYSEELPSEITLLATPEVTLGTTTQNQQTGFNDVYFNGLVYGGEEAIITFEVEVDRYPSDGSGTIDFDEVVYTYEDDYGVYEGFVDPFIFTLGEPLGVDVSLYEGDEEIIAIGDQLEYTITVRNYIDQTLVIDSLSITSDGALNIIEADIDLEETDDRFGWSGSLGAGQHVEFYIVVEPYGGGDHEISADAIYHYETEEEQYTESGSASFTIDVVSVVPKITLNSGGTYDGGEAIIIEYTINNSDPAVSYSNEEVSIATDSSLFDTINYIVSIPADSLYLVSRQEFVTPYSDLPLAYDIEIEGTYGGSTYSEDATITINAATFTSPYVIEYTVDGVDEDYTNVTMDIVLLTTMTTIPSKLAVVHTADDYKKTVSLTTDEISALFSEGVVERSWSIATLAFSGDIFTLNTQLQYSVGEHSWYKSRSIALPIYEEFVEGNESVEVNQSVGINGTGNETIVGNVTSEFDVGTAQDTTTEEETTLVISGEKESTIKKWIFFILVLLLIGFVAVSVKFYVQKHQKAAARKKRIEQISGQETSIGEKANMFGKAKEIVIHDAPSPVDGYEKLHSYIQHAVSQGKTGEEIKKVLIAKGWLEDVLDSWINRLK